MFRKIFPVLGLIFLLSLVMPGSSSTSFAQTSEIMMFGVDDQGEINSQFFTVNLSTGEAAELGPLYEDYDIEAIGKSPVTEILYAIAGGDGWQDGNLYIVDQQTGALSLVGNTGTGGRDEIVSASFHPDGTLWVWQENVGLHTVNLQNGSLTLQWAVSSQPGITDNWEGLAWDLDGRFLYGADQDRLYRWDPNTQTATQLCGDSYLYLPTESLEFHPDGRLLAGWHKAADFTRTIYEVDFTTCSKGSAGFNISFDDIESFAFMRMEGPGEELPIPPGTDKLTAQVFIDHRCDGTYQRGIDVPVANVPITLSFPDGSQGSLETTAQGWVYFAGFEAGQGVTVSAHLPATYRGVIVQTCPGSPTSFELSPGDFKDNVIKHKHLQFRLHITGGMP